jgi:hypothetical protein
MNSPADLTWRAGAPTGKSTERSEGVKHGRPGAAVVMASIAAPQSPE